MFEDDDELNALVDERDMSEEAMLFLAHAFLREKNLLVKFREYVRKTFQESDEEAEEPETEEDDDTDEEEVEESEDDE